MYIYTHIYKYIYKCTQLYIYSIFFYECPLLIPYIYISIYIHIIGDRIGYDVKARPKCKETLNPSRAKSMAG